MTDPLPDTLFHYTNSVGLRGILSTNTIWLTDYRFLNDARELEYGKNRASEILVQMKEDATTEFQLQLDRIEDKLSSPEIFCFVACFCSVDDLLSQWRGYAEDTIGYSIGFDTKLLLEAREDIQLLPIIYDRTLQEDSLRDAINGYSSVIASSDVSARVRTADDLLHTMICSKHSSFAEEKEWRLVHAWDGWKPGTGPFGLKFRDSPSFMIPYLEHRLPATDGLFGKRVLPIRSVRCGPGPEPKNAKDAVADFLWEHGYSDVEVLRSESTLRR